MTGQEFIDKLTTQVMERGKLQAEYTAADLTQDASAAGLWYRRPSSQQMDQVADLDAAFEQVRTLTEKIGGSQ